MNKNRIFTTTNIAKIAILSAIAYVLMLLDFPILFVPPFYKLDFSEVAVLVGGFSMGPLTAVLIEAIKIILKSMTGTSTAYVGELANFFIGAAFVFPAAFIYKKHKSKKNALIGLIIGGLMMTLVGVLLNYYILLPAYSYFYNIPIEAIIGMGTAIVPLITNKFTFVLLATTPFNIFKAIVVSAVTMLIYKHISSILHR